MGGDGSGKWSRLEIKAKTNTLFRINMNDLRRSSGLKPGARGEVEWRKEGVLVSSLKYLITPESQPT